MLLLKLESMYNVSGKCIDDLVEQFNYICTLSVQYIPNSISVFKIHCDIRMKNKCTIDQSFVSELAEKLQHCSPLCMKSFGNHYVHVFDGKVKISGDDPLKVPDYIRRF